MPPQQFPCFRWSSHSKVSSKSMLSAFLSRRPDSQWVMVGQDCAQSDTQLWSAWQCASRRWLRNSSLANSLDAEFLRYLSGTHHVSEAFKRAGVNDGDSSGFLVWLPFCQLSVQQPSDLEIEAFDMDSIVAQASEFFAHLGVEGSNKPLELSKKGAQRLGFVFENNDSLYDENTLVGHILSAELHS